MFQTVHLSIIRSVRTACEQDQDGSVLILPASCQQTYMTYIIFVCTVKNS